jgi:hypothetical protein
MACSLKLTFGTQPQFLSGNIDNLAIPPNIDRKPVSSVLFHDFLDGCLERHKSSIDQRQFKNIWRQWFHFIPYKSINWLKSSLSMLLG